MCRGYTHTFGLIIHTHIHTHTHSLTHSYTHTLTLTGDPKTGRFHWTAAIRPVQIYSKSSTTSKKSSWKNDISPSVSKQQVSLILNAIESQWSEYVPNHLQSLTHTVPLLAWALMALYACLLLSLRDIEAMQPNMSSLAARRRESTGADRRSWKTRDWSSGIWISDAV